MAKAEYRNAVRSKQLINSALAELLHEKPLEKITVSDIVRRANINRSTFYAHYVDIYAVLDNLIEQTFDQIRESFQQETPLDYAPNRILKKIQYLLESDLGFYKIIMTSSVASTLQERIATVVLESLANHKEIIAAKNPSEYEIPIIFCTGGLIRLYQSWFAGKLPITLDELTQQATDMIFRTIKTQK